MSDIRIYICSLQEVYMQLSLNKATTKELIETYFLEKLNEQVMAN